MMVTVDGDGGHEWPVSNSRSADSLSRALHFVKPLSLKV